MAGALARLSRPRRDLYADDWGVDGPELPLVSGRRDAHPFGNNVCYENYHLGPLRMPASRKAYGDATVAPVAAPGLVKRQPSTISVFGNENDTVDVWSLWLSGKTCTEPPDRDDLTILGCKEVKPARLPHGFSFYEAVKVALDSMKKARELKTEAFKYVTPAQSAQQIPLYFFNELDAFLFGGVLRGNVQVLWREELPMGLLGTTRRPAKPGERIRIALSAELAITGDAEAIFEVLVHQMIHAFLLQCCEPRNEKIVSARHSLSHTGEFSALACAVREALGFLPLDYPAVFGCTPGSSVEECFFREQYLDEKSNLLKNSICVADDHGKRLESCTQALLTISSTITSPNLRLASGCAKLGDRLLAVSQWLHEKPGAIKPVLKVDYDRTAKDYVELRYDNRAYPIPRKSCPENSCAKFTLDEDITDRETFKIVFDYLTTGKYSPAPPSFIAGVTNWGPPVIGVGQPQEAPYFLPQIRAYRAAIMLGFPKLREIALERLEKSGRSYCVEDPIVMLEMLYHGTTTLGASTTTDTTTSRTSTATSGTSNAMTASSASYIPARPPPPDRDLRAWVRSFLKVATGDKNMPTNLELLKRGEVWKSRWVALRVKGKKLLEDADAVEEEVAVERKKKEKKKEADAKAEQEQLSLQAMTMAFKRLATGGIGADPSSSLSSSTTMGLGAMNPLLAASVGLGLPGLPAIAAIEERKKAEEMREGRKKEREIDELERKIALADMLSRVKEAEEEHKRREKQRDREEEEREKRVRDAVSAQRMLGQSPWSGWHN